MTREESYLNLSLLHQLGAVAKELSNNQPNSNVVEELNGFQQHFSPVSLREKCIPSSIVGATLAPMTHITRILNYDSNMERIDEQF